MKQLLLLILFFVLAISASIYWFYDAAKPVSNNTTQKDFLIVKGSTAAQIGTSLQKEGLVKSPIAFKIYVQATGKQAKVQAGEYRFSSSYSLFKLVDVLLKGPVEIWVTIPEGFRREEIAQKFASSFGKDSSFVEEFLAVSKGEEGFLFPDTYLFPKSASASAVVARMKVIFDRQLDSQMRKDIDLLSHSLAEIVTMASIIERETKRAEERPIVAGILFKRLKAGWPLQADATLQYAIASVKCQVSSVRCDKWWEPLTHDDLEIKSPYNTYTHPGLPPVPIANPGVSSIKAAIYPADTPYWFYLHDSSGQIHYAKTLDEHNENVRKYLEK